MRPSEISLPGCSPHTSPGTDLAQDTVACSIPDSAFRSDVLKYVRRRQSFQTRPTDVLLFGVLRILPCRVNLAFLLGRSWLC